MNRNLLRSAPVLLVLAAALFLGGTGGAVAGKLITGQQIKDNSLTTRDVKNGTLRSADFAPGAVRGVPGPQGPQGPAGPAGPQGPRGEKGEAGSALASARVAPDGAVSRARVFGAPVASGPILFGNRIGVDKTGTGQYCVTVSRPGFLGNPTVYHAKPADNVLVATLGIDTTAGAFGLVRQAGACAGGNGFLVQTFTTGGGFVDLGFNLMVN